MVRQCQQSKRDKMQAFHDRNSRFARSTGEIRSRAQLNTIDDVIETVENIVTRNHAILIRMYNDGGMWPYDGIEL